MKANTQMIFDIISTSHAHLTAEQIYLKLKESSHKTVLATVYNNLKTLLNDGLIKKVSVEGYPDRYELAGRHDHLLCKKCGSLSDIVLRDLTSEIEEQTHEDIQSYDLKISYLCSNCRAH